ncbi:hypothetical protein [Alloalcanivorax gelatiniphagus]|uniref:Uncharacterized protein n=1 Tax=Alloalcanivorax gelatiniphagus TaxID=1194167 RepID=A0ABY2XMY0_9GAMM|nr:hypothetical protein [Alloalcanivorax gelatiniphagus]TMW13739.1 hypothetical protein FGS76_06325 [Alloalcanivorax gelatiniphagus]
METAGKSKGRFALTLAVISLLGVIYLLLYQFTEGKRRASQIGMLTMTVKGLQATNMELASELKALQTTTQDLNLDYLLRKFRYNVDFATPDVQEINKGFMVVRASQEEHLTGIKFEGRIINTQSVTHENLTFRITANEKSKEFNVNKISPGNSTAFSVYMPDLNAEDSRYATLEYMSSSVKFYIR